MATDTDTGLKIVLCEIRRLADARRPGQEMLEREAYFIWRRRGGGGGADQADWFAAERELVVNDEYWKIDHAMKCAADIVDYKLQLALSVARNVAVFLGQRPTDVGPDTSLEALDNRQIALIVAGVGHDLHLRLDGWYRFALSVKGLVDRIWQEEYKVRKSPRTTPVQ